MLELQTHKPVLIDADYLKRKGFNLRKRPMSLTIKMLHNFIEVRNKETGENLVTEIPENVTQSRVEYIKKSREEKEKEKIRFLEFVFLTPDEHTKLVEKFGETRTAALIDELNTGIGSKGYRYKSHYFTVLSWARRNPRKETSDEQFDRLKKAGKI